MLFKAKSCAKDELNNDISASTRHPWSAVSLLREFTTTNSSTVSICNALPAYNAEIFSVCAFGL